MSKNTHWLAVARHYYHLQHEDKTPELKAKTFPKRTH